MSQTRPPLPDFANPPVIEVALSVQFNPLTELQAPQLGLLWNEFRSRFPKAEQQSPLDSVTEKFGVRGQRKVDVRFEMKVPVPRCWFLNEAGTELIQVQQGTDLLTTGAKSARKTPNRAKVRVLESEIVIKLEFEDDKEPTWG